MRKEERREQHSWHIPKESLSDPQLTCVSYTHTSAYLCVCLVLLFWCGALTCHLSSFFCSVASLSNLPLPAHYSISFGVSISPAFPFPFLQFLHFRLVWRMWQSMKYFTRDRDLPGLASTATSTWLGLIHCVVVVLVFAHTHSHTHTWQ